MFEKKKPFSIPFIGLKPGEHNFEYTIDELFFEGFGYSEIKKGNFSIDIVLLKQEDLLTFGFSIKGKAKVICDRCLEEFEIPVETGQKLFVSFGETTHEETDEIFILSYHEQEIDLSRFIYEYIVLSIPLVRIHPKGQCDPELEKKIEELKPKPNFSDPRWDLLKNLKNKN